MPHQLTLSCYPDLPEEKRVISSVEELHEGLARVSGFAYAEVWLNYNSPQYLSMLLNNTHQRALLTEGENLHPVAQDYDVNADWVQAIIDEYHEDYEESDEEEVYLDFTLSNGQIDSYRAACTLPRDTAFKVIEHFFLTGERAPFVQWDDSDIA